MLMLLTRWKKYGALKLVLICMMKRTTKSHRHNQTTKKNSFPKNFWRLFLRLLIICLILFVISYFAGLKAADTFQLRSNALTLRTQKQNPFTNQKKDKNTTWSQTEQVVVPAANVKCDDRPGRGCYDYGNFIGKCDLSDPNNLQCLACKDCLGVDTPNGAGCAERQCYTKGAFEGCNKDQCSQCPEYIASCNVVPIPVQECFVLDCNSLVAGGACFSKVSNPDGAGVVCNQAKGLYDDQNTCFSNIVFSCIAGKILPTSVAVPTSTVPTPAGGAVGCTPHDWTRCTIPSGECCANWGHDTSCGWNNGQSWYDCQKKCQDVANASSTFCQSQSGGGTNNPTPPNTGGGGSMDCCPDDTCRYISDVSHCVVGRSKNSQAECQADFRIDWNCWNEWLLSSHGNLCNNFDTSSCPSDCAKGTRCNP